jgi:agmatine deiminase
MRRVSDATPKVRGLSMPAEWAPHERTLMAWPCRLDMWEQNIRAAREEYAGIANAIAAFEPVLMVCRNAADAADARAALSAGIELVEHPLDDSWMRDNGPIFVTGGGERVGVHFRFNAWGEKFTPWDADEAAGGWLAERHGTAPPIEAPFVLEGGSIAVDGHGTLLTTEQCLLNPNRNPSMSREEIEAGLIEQLGMDRVVWLGDGLVGDKDTDGHVDLICVPLGENRVLLQSTPPGTPDHEPMAENARRAREAGIEVVDFGVLAEGELGGDPVTHSYLNLYLCNEAAIVPLAGMPEEDEAALARLREVFAGDREVVGVPALTVAWGGGGPHCITQQVPAVGLRGGR